LQAFSRFVVFSKLWERQGFESKENQTNFKEQVHKNIVISLKDYYYWLIKTESNAIKSNIYKLFRKTII
jgi:hypothetical protein